MMKKSDDPKCRILLYRQSILIIIKNNYIICLYRSCKKLRNRYRNVRTKIEIKVSQWMKLFVCVLTQNTFSKLKPSSRTWCGHLSDDDQNNNNKKSPVSSCIYFFSIRKKTISKTFKFLNTGVSTRWCIAKSKEKDELC